MFLNQKIITRRLRILSPQDEKYPPDPPDLFRPRHISAELQSRNRPRRSKPHNLVITTRLEMEKPWECYQGKRGNRNFGYRLVSLWYSQSFRTCYGKLVFFVKVFKRIVRK